MINQEDILNFIKKPIFDEKLLLSKDSSWPKISVVTPSFNQARFLERTILSVLNQNYPNLEYMVIDGGSSDGSKEIIAKYRKYLTYAVSENDKGQSDAINKGVKVATGEICAYINSDDIYTPGTLHAIAKTFIADKKADLIYGHAYVTDIDDKIYNICVALPFSLKEHVFEVFSLPQPSSFWRRKVYDKVDGFNVDDKSCMDHEFYAMAAKFGFKFKKINLFFSCFRKHGSSITVSGRMRKYARTEMDKVRINLGYGSSKIVRIIFNALYRFKYVPLKFIMTLFCIGKIKLISRLSFFRGFSK